MPTLNEIQHEISTILDSLETATAEEMEQLQDSLDSYLGELATMEAEKADSIAFIIRQQMARIDMLKAEEKRIRIRRQSAERQLSRTKSYFQAVMEQHGLKKIQGVSSTLYLKKNESVEITAMEYDLPKQFQRVKTEVSADKKAIKAFLKDGNEINGCELVESFSLNVR